MTITQQFKHRLVSILVTLSISLLMIACSSEEDLNASAANNATGISSQVTEINLLWTAPAERENNTPLSLSEVAGYRLYYGTIQGDYQNEIHIDDSSAETYSLTGLSHGIYYLVITAYDIDGRESRYSPEIKIVI